MVCRRSSRSLDVILEFRDDRDVSCTLKGQWHKREGEECAHGPHLSNQHLNVRIRSRFLHLSSFVLIVFQLTFSKLAVLK